MLTQEDGIILKVLLYMLYFGTLLLMPILGCIFDGKDDKW